MFRRFVSSIVAVTRRTSSRSAAAALLAACLVQAALVAPTPCSATTAALQQLAERRVVPVSQLSFGSQVLDAQMPVLVDFSAPWCIPCRAIAKSLDEVVATGGGRVRIVRVDVGWSHRLAKRYGVAALPALLLFNHGQVIDRETGAMGADDIRDMLANGVQLVLAAAPPAAVVASR
jgi:thioredoxin